MAGPKLTLGDRERGRRIAALRTSLGESQAEFGERFGVEQATISRWEQGHPVQRRYWSPIAKLASQSAAEFFLGQQLDVPLLSWVAASRLRDAGDVPHPNDAPSIAASGLPPGKWFALKVEGDSMDRVAPPGSIIFVDNGDRALEHHRFYVFDGPDGATFKRYAANPPRLEPVSTNPAHETIFPQRELRVVGRVRRVVTEL